VSDDAPVRDARIEVDTTARMNGEEVHRCSKGWL
jgi:hypothetical protein